MRKPKPTFFSPPTEETKIERGKRVRGAYFFLYQPGSEPLKLEYQSIEEADVSLFQFSGIDGCHFVPSADLFWDIVAAVESVKQEE